MKHRQASIQPNFSYRIIPHICTYILHLLSMVRIYKIFVIVSPMFYLETNQWINPQYPDLDLLVVLPVDNDGGDLLVHEDEDGGQQGEHRG